MKKKRQKIPPIRVGSTAITLIEADGVRVYRCTLVALYRNGEVVQEVDADTYRGVTGDVQRPDGTTADGWPLGSAPRHWCRPFISSMTMRYA